MDSRGGEAHTALLEAIEIADDMEKPRGGRVYVHPNTPQDMVGLLKKYSKFIQKVGSWPAYCEVWAKAFAAFEEACASGGGARGSAPGGSGSTGGDEPVGRRVSERIRALNTASQAESRNLSAAGSSTGVIGRGGGGSSTYNKSYTKVQAPSASGGTATTDAAVGDVEGRPKERESPWSRKEEFLAVAEKLLKEAAEEDIYIEDDREIVVAEWCRRWPPQVQTDLLQQGDEREILKASYKFLFAMTGVDCTGWVVAVLPVEWLDCSPAGVSKVAMYGSKYLTESEFAGKSAYETVLNEVAEADIVLGVVHVAGLIRSVLVADLRTDQGYLIGYDGNLEWPGRQMDCVSQYLGIAQVVDKNVYVERVVWAQFSAAVSAATGELKDISLSIWGSAEASSTGGAWKQAYDRLWTAKAFVLFLSENEGECITDVDGLDRALDRLTEKTVLENICGQLNVPALPFHMHAGGQAREEGSQSAEESDGGAGFLEDALEEEMEELTSNNRDLEDRPLVAKRPLERRDQNVAQELNEDSSELEVSPIKKAPRSGNK